MHVMNGSKDYAQKERLYNDSTHHAVCSQLLYAKGQITLVNSYQPNAICLVFDCWCHEFLIGNFARVFAKVCT